MLMVVVFLQALRIAECYRCQEKEGSFLVGASGKALKHEAFKRQNWGQRAPAKPWRWGHTQSMKVPVSSLCWLSHGIHVGTCWRITRLEVLVVAGLNCQAKKLGLFSRQWGAMGNFGAIAKELQRRNCIIETALLEDTLTAGSRKCRLWSPQGLLSCNGIFLFCILNFSLSTDPQC